jgi:hypothetical protein
MTATRSGASFRLEDGFFIGSYRVIRALRRDALGEIYLAKRPADHRQVLLRLLPAAAPVSAAAAERLAAASELEHEAISRSTPVQREGRHVFVVCDCPVQAGGEVVFLSDELEQSATGGLGEVRVRSVALALARGLSQAHRFRGSGIPCGMPAAEAIVLTGRRQPRICHYGVGAAFTPEYTLEEDIHQFGLLLYRLLSGLPEMDPNRAPSSFGFSRSWDRLIGGCLQAGGEGGYADMEELVQALETLDAAPRRGPGRRVFVTAACLVAVLALAAGAWFLTRRGRADAPAPTGASARKPAPASPAVSGSAAAVAAAVPEASLKQQLTVLEPVKKKALAAYSRAVDVPTGEGFQGHIERLRKLAAQAQGLLSGMEIDKATAAYRHLDEEAGKLLEADRTRNEALHLREQLSDAVDAAAAGPVRLPKEDMRGIGQLRRDADTALAQGRAAAAKAAYPKKHVVTWMVSQLL